MNIQFLDGICFSKTKFIILFQLLLIIKNLKMKKLKFLYCYNQSKFYNNDM